MHDTILNRIIKASLTSPEFAFPDDIAKYEYIRDMRFNWRYIEGCLIGVNDRGSEALKRRTPDAYELLLAERGAKDSFASKLNKGGGGEGNVGDFERLLQVGINEKWWGHNGPQEVSDIYSQQMTSANKKPITRPTLALHPVDDLPTLNPLPFLPTSSNAIVIETAGSSWKTTDKDAVERNVKATQERIWTGLNLVHAAAVMGGAIATPLLNNQKPQIYWLKNEVKSKAVDFSFSNDLSNNTLTSAASNSYIRPMHHDHKTNFTYPDGTRFTLHDETHLKPRFEQMYEELNKVPAGGPSMIIIDSIKTFGLTIPQLGKCLKRAGKMNYGFSRKKWTFNVEHFDFEKAIDRDCLIVQLVPTAELTEPHLSMNNSANDQAVSITFMEARIAEFAVQLYEAEDEVPSVDDLLGLGLDGLTKERAEHIHLFCAGAPRRPPSKVSNNILALFASGIAGRNITYGINYLNPPA
ncbi:hypothetical protein JCM5353_003181 [Sporobolomyces roseus]